MTTARFQIEADPIGHSLVQVDGVDITPKVAALRIETQLGAPTILTLHSSGAGTISGEGIVQVTSGEETGTLEEAARFVSELDPETVEKEAISRSDFEPTAKLMKLVLDVVADALRGKV